MFFSFPALFQLSCLFTRNGKSSVGVLGGPVVGHPPFPLEKNRSTWVVDTSSLTHRRLGAEGICLLSPAYPRPFRFLLGFYLLYSAALDCTMSWAFGRNSAIAGTPAPLSPPLSLIDFFFPNAMLVPDCVDRSTLSMPLTESNAPAKPRGSRTSS